MSQQFNSLNLPALNFAVDSNKNTVELSVIIPVYKNLNGLKNTISDIRNSQIPVSFEIIVCNDGADRFISDWLADQGLHEVKIPKQKGSYFARNRGIEVAQGNWLLFVDSDVRVLPNWYQSIENYLYEYSYFAFNILVTPPENANLFKRYSVYTEFKTTDFFDFRHFGVAAFLLVKKKLTVLIGPFYEQIMSGGDLEFGYRVYNKKIGQYYQREKFVMHEPRSLTQKFRKKIRSNQGLLILNLMGKIELYDKFSLKNGLLMPFKSIYRIYKKIIESKSSSFSKFEILIAESAEYLIILITFYFTLFSKPFFWFKIKKHLQAK